MHPQPIQKLTLESVQVRGVLVPLRRPLVAKVGEFTHWPLIQGAGWNGTKTR